MVRKKNLVSTLWITIVGIGCGDKPEEGVSTTSVGSTNFDVTARPCRSDIFFFEKPSWAAPFAAAYQNNLRMAVQAQLQNDWFDAPPALLGAVQVQVWPVLPHRTEPWRTDGHRRFYRLIFHSPNLGRLKVKPEMLCEVVFVMRSVQSIAGSEPPTTRIGRECDATAMGLGRFASTESKTWHWDRLGVSTVPPVINETSSTRVALIDSGVRPDLAATLSVDDGGEFISGPFGTNNGAQFHAHGTFMAAYLRHLAPQVDLRSYRAIDKQGVATTASLGLAIDTALYDTIEPLIINLSLGFPPELSRRAVLATSDPGGGVVCSTYEDGISELLRYVLYLSRYIDENHRPVSTFSAAGNRAAPIEDPSLFHSMPTMPTLCGTEAIPLGMPANFFPAALDDLDTCRRFPGSAMLTEPRSVTTAVGSTESSDAPSGFAIYPAEPAIVAPGDYVFAARSGLPVDENGILCNTNQGHSEFFDFPAPLTGSSVSAALVSGAAARAQVSLPSQGFAEFNSAQLSRLIYLTGEPTCRERADGTPIRRISVGQLDAAIRSCPRLIECARDTDDFDRPIDKETLDDCWAEVVACGLTTACMTHRQVNAFGCDLPDRLTCAQGGTNCITTEMGCVSDCYSDFGCVTGPMAPAEGEDPYSIGSLGPEPPTSHCPDCNAAMKVDPQFDLVAGLTSGFEPGTTLADPELAFYDEFKSEVLRIELLEITAQPEWVPGKVVIMRQIDPADYCPDAICLQQVDDILRLGDGAVFLETVLQTPSNGGKARDQSLIKINRE